MDGWVGVFSQNYHGARTVHRLNSEVFHGAHTVHNGAQLNHIKKTKGKCFFPQKALCTVCTVCAPCVHREKSRVHRVCTVTKRHVSIKKRGPG
jgi:hypothetical protein